MRIVTTLSLAIFAATANSGGVPAAVTVSDVEGLYAAVNDPVNAGATVVLSPGHYSLTKLDPLGAARPNGGRLELQPNMSLLGVAGRAAEAVIDGSGVNGPSYAVPGAGGAGPIRIGRGRQSVEWLTILGSPAAAAGVVTDMIGTDPPSLRLAHVVSTGSVRGVDVRNQGTAAFGRQLTIEFEDDELFGNVTNNGQGIRFVNSGADGASIVATLRRNYSHDNNIGFLASNLGSSRASIAIDSHDDRFEANIVGAVIFGGLTQTAATVANEDTVTFTMHAGSIAGNHGTLPPQTFSGGLDVVGGSYSVQGTAGSTSNNAVQVSIWGTSFGDNDAPDVSAWGAKAPAALLAGTDNTVVIDLHGKSAQASTFSTNSAPDEPAGTNRATVVR
jgi:hypothetical protein